MAWEGMRGSVPKKQNLKRVVLFFILLLIVVNNGSSFNWLNKLYKYQLHMSSHFSHQFLLDSKHSYSKLIEIAASLKQRVQEGKFTLRVDKINKIITINSHNFYNTQPNSHNLYNFQYNIHKIIFNSCNNQYLIHSKIQT